MGRAVRSVIVKGIADFCTRVLAFITFPVMANYLGADGYGAYSQLISIVGFVTPFASLGIPGSIVRYFADVEWVWSAKKKYCTLFFIVTCSGVVCSLVVCLFSGLINDMFVRWVHGQELFVVGGFLIAMTALENLLNELLRSRLWIFQLSTTTLLKAALNAVLSIYVLISGYGLVTVVSAVMAVTLLFLSLNFAIVMLRRSDCSDSDDKFTSFRLSNIVFYGMSLTVAGMGLSLMHIGSRFVLGYFEDIKNIGLYGFCYNFALLLVSVGSPVLWPVYPCLVKSLQGHDIDNAKKMIKEYHKYMTLILVPAAVYLAAMMNNIGGLLGGNGFVGNIFVPIFVVAAIFFDQWNGLAQYVLAAKDRVVFLRNAWLAMGVANFLLSLLLIPYSGILGAAIVSFITFLVLEVIIFWRANRIVNLADSYRFDLFLPIVFFSLVAFYLDRSLFYSFLTSKLGLVFFSMFYAFFYVVILFATRNVALNDIKRIFNR